MTNFLGILLILGKSAHNFPKNAFLYAIIGLQHKGPA
jgi:hypothetical protein